MIEIVGSLLLLSMLFIVPALLIIAGVKIFNFIIEIIFGLGGSDG